MGFQIQQIFVPVSFGPDVETLKNNELKITYFTVVTGTSGTIIPPSQATFNSDEFGLSGNAILSEIDGSGKPTLISPKTADGAIVTATLNTTTGAWLASGIYTSVSVAIIYSLKIKAIYYSNLTYFNIIESESAHGIPSAVAPLFYDSTNDRYTTLINTSKLLGRTTAGAGAVEEVALGANLSFSGNVLNSANADLSISNKTANTLDVNSSTGSDITVPQATITEAGLLNATDKVKLNNTSGTNSGDNASNSTSNSYADALIIDSIADADTTHAPSRNAVFDALALKVDKSANLSDIANKQTARANLLVDKRVAVGNINYSILSTDKEVVTSVAFTAARIFTLPLANTLNPGQEFIISDELGTVTNINTLTIATSGSDTINGVATEVIMSAFGMRRLFSDGVSKYTFDAGVLRASKNLSDINNASTARANLGLTIGTDVAAISDNYFTIKCIANSLNPVDSTTYYTGDNVNVPNTIASNFQFNMGFKFSIIGAIVSSAGNTTAGTAENVSLKIRNITQSISSTVGNFQSNASAITALQFTFTGLNIVIEAADLMACQFDTPAWVTNPVAVRWYVTLICKRVL